MFLLLIVVGLLLLVAGGEILVRGASRLALGLGVSPLIVGLTLVGFGTSTPELVTSLQAAFAGSSAIALGNVVGSNTANILLILGIAALIAPFAIERATFIRDGFVVLLAAVLALAGVMMGALGRAYGGLLLVGLIAYLVFLIIQERKQTVVASEGPAMPRDPIWLSLLLIIAGIGLTIVGARTFVDGALTIAREFGVSETVLGLTLVAVGTSLPELVTSAIAAIRGQSALAFGNVVGSNIYNILGILGITAIVHPLSVPAEIAAVDIWVMLAATLGLLYVSVTGWKVTRLEGGILVAIYLAYTGWLISVAT